MLETSLEMALTISVMSYESLCSSFKYISFIYLFSTRVFLFIYLSFVEVDNIFK